VAVAPATPATGQVPNSAETIGSLQGGAKLDDVGLMGPVTLTPTESRHRWTSAGASRAPQSHSLRRAWRWQSYG
jgi:hypothetical protein